MLLSDRAHPAPPLTPQLSLFGASEKIFNGVDGL